MKLRSLAAALVLFAAFAATSRADEFSALANNPRAYWVPLSATYTPRPGYYGPPPPPYYYPPPPPAPPPVFGGIFFHFHFH